MGWGIASCVWLRPFAGRVARPFGRSPAREEAVIRARFEILHYLSDVMAGSAVGIIAGRTETGERIFRLKRWPCRWDGDHVRPSRELN
jgi:hypothetical protein